MPKTKADEMMNMLIGIKTEVAGIRQHLKDMNGKMLDFNDFKESCPARMETLHSRINEVTNKLHNTKTWMLVGIITVLFNGMALAATLLLK